MRKLLAAAAVAAVATLGLAAGASAQGYDPTTPTNVPARVGGAYGYPSQYPTYPGQYSTASHKRRHRADEARRDRDGDDDDRGSQNASRDRYERGSNYGYGANSNYGYGSNAGTNGVPSRVGAPSRSTYGERHDRRRDRDRDRR